MSRCDEGDPHESSFPNLLHLDGVLNDKSSVSSPRVDRLTELSFLSTSSDPSLSLAHCDFPHKSSLPTETRVSEESALLYNPRTFDGVLDDLSSACFPRTEKSISSRVKSAHERSVSIKASDVHPLLDVYGVHRGFDEDDTRIVDTPFPNVSIVPTRVEEHVGIEILFRWSPALHDESLDDSDESVASNLVFYHEESLFPSRLDHPLSPLDSTQFSLALDDVTACVVSFDTSRTSSASLLELSLKISNFLNNLGQDRVSETSLTFPSTLEYHSSLDETISAQNRSSSNQGWLDSKSPEEMKRPHPTHQPGRLDSTSQQPQHRDNLDIVMTLDIISLVDYFCLFVGVRLSVEVLT